VGSTIFNDFYSNYKLGLPRVILPLYIKILEFKVGDKNSF
jgi:hypothetical protein